MSNYLNSILQMSLHASIAIIVVLILRLALKKIPKKVFFCLWYVVVIRLICPFNFGSWLSLFNLKHMKAIEKSAAEIGYSRTSIIVGNYNHAVDSSSSISENVSALANNVNRTSAQYSSSVAAVTRNSFSLKQFFMSAILYIWIAGIVCIAAYSIYKFIKLWIMLKGSNRVNKNIFMSKKIDSPFVLGLVHPHIYLPNDTGDEYDYLLMHERMHIKYKDHIFKYIAFVATVMHWFNPLAWLAFNLMSKDMEMKCDEYVIDELGQGIKKKYSMSLVSYAAHSKPQVYVVGPIYFSVGKPGGTEVKMRVKNILKYKRISRVASLAIATITVGGVLLLSACGENVKDNNSTITVVETTEAAVTEATSNGVVATTEEKSQVIEKKVVKNLEMEDSSVKTIKVETEYYCPNCSEELEAANYCPDCDMELEPYVKIKDAKWEMPSKDSINSFCPHNEDVNVYGAEFTECPDLVLTMEGTTVEQSDDAIYTYRDLLVSPNYECKDDASIKDIIEQMEEQGYEVKTIKEKVTVNGSTIEVGLVHGMELIKIENEKCEILRMIVGKEELCGPCFKNTKAYHALDQGLFMGSLKEADCEESLIVYSFK